MTNTSKNIKLNLDYSDFSGGITECNRKMSLLTEQFKLQSAQLGNNADEVDQLQLKESLLNQKIELQTQVMNQSLEKWNAMANSEEASIAQIEKAHIAYQKQATKLQELQNELDKTTSEITKLENSEEELAEKSENTSSSMSSFGTTMLEIVNAATAVSSVLAAVGEAIDGISSHTAGYADNLKTMSAVTSLSTETLQELTYASSFVDTSLDTMTSSMTKMIGQMQNAAEGSDSARAKFENLGLSWETTGGQLKSSEQMFFEVIDALGNIKNETERDAAAMDIFGKSAQQLNPLIEAGSGALRSYMAEAEQVGYVVGGATIEAWSMAQDSIDRFNLQLEASQRTIAGAFAPAIASLYDILSELPTPVLGVIAIGQSALPLMNSLISTWQLLTTTKVMSTMATQGQVVAETEKVAIDGVATASALALNAAMLPQIAIAAALVGAFALLVAGIYMLIDAFTSESEAADKATQSTSNFLNASKQLGNSASMAANSTSYMASGGTSSGGLTWVGEQGAELVNLPKGSTVYNHEESKSMMNSTNNYYVTIDAKNVTDFNRVVNIFSGLGQSMNRGNTVNG